MKRAWNRNFRNGRNRSRERKILLLVLVAIVASATAVIMLIAISTLPSLAYRSFAQTTAERDGVIVDWPTLYLLSTKARKAELIGRKLLESPVYIPGYMLGFEEAPDERGQVAEFLLVPDPGNWLHPPHLESGEVVLVRMEEGVRTPLLSRKPVWVKGRLSTSLFKSSRLETIELLTASSVREFESGR